MKNNKVVEKNAPQITLELILEEERKMKTQEGTDNYWTTQEALKSELGLFIRLSHNLSALSTNELLQVCRMVGSYRPIALHSFFIYCANALSEK